MKNNKNVSSSDCRLSLFPILNSERRFALMVIGEGDRAGGNVQSNTAKWLVVKSSLPLGFFILFAFLSKEL